MNHLCSECGLQIFKQSYKENLALHKEEKIICDLCGKMFCTTGRLKGHQLVYHGKELYSCDKCNKTFGKKRSSKSAQPAWEAICFCEGPSIEVLLHDEGFGRQAKIWDMDDGE